jgi:hypothetical protein
MKNINELNIFGDMELKDTSRIVPNIIILSIWAGVFISYKIHSKKLHSRGRIVFSSSLLGKSKAKQSCFFTIAYETLSYLALGKNLELQLVY